jgi:hypothetical protein
MWCGHCSADESLANFRRRVECVRQQLRTQIDAVEAFLQTPALPAKKLDVVLPSLRAAYSEFRALHRSSVAWQDIHGVDADLMSRAVAALRKLGG